MRIHLMRLEFRAVRLIRLRFTANPVFVCSGIATCTIQDSGKQASNSNPHEYLHESLKQMVFLKVPLANDILPNACISETLSLFPNFRDR